MTEPGEGHRVPSTSLLVCLGAAGAALLFAFFGVAQLVGVVNAHNNFPRLRAPGAGEVALPRGTAFVWLERDPKRPIKPGTMEVHVYDADTRVEIPMAAAPGEEYHTFGRDGTAIGTIDVPRTGTYLVVARGGGGNSVAVGKIATGFLTGWAIAWFLLAGAALFLAVGAGVMVLLRRRGQDPSSAPTEDSQSPERVA